MREGRLCSRVATSFHYPSRYTDEDESPSQLRAHPVVPRRVRDGPRRHDGHGDSEAMSRIGVALHRRVRRCVQARATTVTTAAGFGIANVLAAYEAGIPASMGAAAGLGGWRLTGVTGNIATEDLVYLFARMGGTSIDLDKLLEVAEIAARLRAPSREAIFARSSVRAFSELAGLAPSQHKEPFQPSLAENGTIGHFRADEG